MNWINDIQLGLKLLLTTKEKNRILFLTLAQMLTSLIDLIGVALLGFTTSLIIRGLNYEQPGNRLNSLLKLLQINNLNLRVQVSILAILITIVFLIKSIIGMFLTKSVYNFLSLTSAKKSTELFSMLFSQDITKLTSKSNADITYMLYLGLNSLFMQVFGSISLIISDISLILILFIGLLFADFSIAIISVTFFGLIVLFVTKFLHIKVSEIGNQQRISSIKNQEILENTYLNLRLIRSRNNLNNLKANFSAARLSGAEADASILFFNGMNKYILDVSVVLGMLLVSTYEFLIQDPYRAIANLALFVAASSRIAPSLFRLQQNYLMMKNHFSRVQPTIELWREFTIENTEPNQNYNYVESFKPEIKFHNVFFNYPNSGFNLANLNFEISLGEKCAIVGSTGSGKSTIADLIIGLIRPTSGKILVSNLEPNICIGKFSGEIAYVPQSVSIIQGTLRENLLFGLEGSNVKDEFLYNLLQSLDLFELFDGQIGLETQIGNVGSTLSGGQRQRIGIARALITNPKLLIMDEATSNLDAQSEDIISKFINGLRGQVTVLIIAHRLSTIKDADQIIYIEKGRILGSGNFEELKKKVPQFAAQTKILGL